MKNKFISKSLQKMCNNILNKNSVPNTSIKVMMSFINENIKLQDLFIRLFL